MPESPKSAALSTSHIASDTTFSLWKPSDTASDTALETTFSLGNWCHHRKSPNPSQSLWPLKLEQPTALLGLCQGHEHFLGDKRSWATWIHRLKACLYQLTGCPQANPSPYSAPQFPFLWKKKGELAEFSRKAHSFIHSLSHTLTHTCPHLPYTQSFCAKVLRAPQNSLCSALKDTNQIFQVLTDPPILSSQLTPQIADVPTACTSIAEAPPHPPGCAPFPAPPC